MERSFAREHSRFMFATGIEGSCPTIASPDGSTSIRVDEMDRTFHYAYWKEDLELVHQLGLRYLRWGPPYYRTHVGPGRYDWEFTDAVMGHMRTLGIEPIVDLCHFGVPDWVGSFQNPDWPALFADYAAAFASRYPWVRFYTPVNEILVCARLSTLAGFWNERIATDWAFVTAVKHLCRANLLAIDAILRRQPEAIFIQSESTEHFHAGATTRACVERTTFENMRRFLPLDLLLSRAPDADMAIYLFDNGMSRDEYRWFMGHNLGERIVIGNDFYERNEQIVLPDGGIAPAGEVFGWSEITRQYHSRYRRAVMHTETNTIASDVDPTRWLWKEFLNVRNLRAQGVPVIGFTWYSLTDQVDWDSGLRLDRGVVNPVGLVDLSRNPRPLAESYREIIERFSDDPLVAGSPFFSIGSDTSRPVEPASVIAPKPKHTVAGRSTRERARVAIARREKVDDGDVDALVREAIDAIGGMGAFVSTGDTVLIKPNLTVWRVSSTGCTTDPRVVAALARLAHDAGAGRVQVGECSSCGQITRDIMAITGMERAARDAGAEPVYFDEVEQIDVSVPSGRILSHIPVPRPLLEADVVIACPKLKTHFLDPVTGAIKLWVGAARQDTMHRLHRDTIQLTVADLMSVTRPDLVVMDAIIAGEGNGPVATRGRFVGCILASDDPVALDVVAGDLAGFDGASMSFPRAAAERGIGIVERERIDVVGVPLDAARCALVANKVDRWWESYPVRVIVGEGVTMEGTLGHFKGFADLWQEDHLWDPVVLLHGTPTFMIGRADDPEFEKHVTTGRYFVLDDVADERYKRDPRVTFIPGSPLGNEMMPIIMQALNIELPAKLVQGMMKAYHAVRARIEG
jgi:beta-glucosidase